METKICSSCRAKLPVSSFSKNARRCKPCNSASVKKWRLDNPDKFAAQQLARVKNKGASKHNPAAAAKTKITTVQYRDNPAQYMREYRAQNREKTNAAQRNYMQVRRSNDAAYRAACIARVGAYRATKTSRTVIDVEFTKLAYAEAKLLATARTELTGFNWDVDHVVPLRGKTVCGLHCWTNFKVVPASSNRSKGNKTWPDKP